MKNVFSCFYNNVLIKKDKVFVQKSNILYVVEDKRKSFLHFFHCFLFGHWSEVGWLVKRMGLSLSALSLSLIVIVILEEEVHFLISVFYKHDKCLGPHQCCNQCWWLQWLCSPAGSNNSEKCVRHKELGWYSLWQRIYCPWNAGDL